MYKKRFAKWGFYKNARRRPTAALSSSQGQRHASPGSIPPPCTISPLPSFGPQDALHLLLFTGVRSWTGAFFEAPIAVQQQATTVGTALQPVPSPSEAKEVSFAFKLVMDLLARGRGDLAGRMARKAFLLVENMLATLAAPALVWNLLEMMHYMIAQQQIQLFHMLLAHVSALVAHDAECGDAASRKFGPRHPLSVLLHGLRGIAREADAAALAHLLTQAWTLNAEMLFSCFHPRLFGLYCLIMWESCSIGPPESIVTSLYQWFRSIDSAGIPLEYKMTKQQLYGHRDRGRDRPFARKQQTQQMQQMQQVTPPSSTESSESGSPPPAGNAVKPAYFPFAHLRATGLAALRAHGGLVLRDGKVVYKGNSALLLRILAGLTTARILDSDPDTDAVEVQGPFYLPCQQDGDENVNKNKNRDKNENANGHDAAHWDLDDVPREELWNMACIIRTLVEINRETRRLDGSAWDSPAAATAAADFPAEAAPTPAAIVKQVRAVVELRSQADGRDDPQVLREMWLLQEALETAGNYDEARRVEQNVYARVGNYLQDIPVDAVDAEQSAEPAHSSRPYEQHHV